MAPSPKDRDTKVSMRPRSSTILAPLIRIAANTAHAVSQKAAGIFRGIRNARDRQRHPERHERVRLHLQLIGRPRRILVVCHGNMCRSPYLEAALRQRLQDIEIASAGFVGSGRPMPQQGRAVAATHGHNLSEHRSQTLDRSVLRNTDLVIVMDERQAQHLLYLFRLAPDRVIVAGDLDPLPGESRAIRDPIGQSAEVFESTFARLDRCAESLASMLALR